MSAPDAATTAARQAVVDALGLVQNGKCEIIISHSLAAARPVIEAEERQRIRQQLDARAAAWSAQLGWSRPQRAALIHAERVFADLLDGAA